MKPTQFSHHIGNIDDRLIQEAGATPDSGRPRRGRNVKKVVLIAAVIALMTCSFVVGAFAINKEPETVYVEKEQQIVTVGDSGISLILPDDWAGKYGVEQIGDGIAVYHLATREVKGYDGVFFWVEYTPERLPMDYVYPYPGFTIAVTETGTYRMTYTSDVQADLDDPASSAEYFTLSAEIKDIKIILSSETLASTTNASNWVQGTAYVEFIKLGTHESIGTADYNAAQSQIIREIVESQDYQLPRVSFWSDLYIMVDGREFWVNSVTGDINTSINGDGNYCAKLSAEDLSRLMDTVNQQAPQFES